VGAKMEAFPPVALPCTTIPALRSTVT
jgi:hypothetical protein